jgi:hypothetical protein
VARRLLPQLARTPHQLWQLFRPSSSSNLYPGGAIKYDFTHRIYYFHSDIKKRAARFSALLGCNQRLHAIAACWAGVTGGALDEYRNLKRLRSRRSFQRLGVCFSVIRIGAARNFMSGQAAAIMRNRKHWQPRKLCFSNRSRSPKLWPACTFLKSELSSYRSWCRTESLRLKPGPVSLLSLGVRSKHTYAQTSSSAPRPAVE